MRDKQENEKIGSGSANENSSAIATPLWKFQETRNRVNQTKVDFSQKEALVFDHSDISYTFIFYSLQTSPKFAAKLLISLLYPQ